MLLILILSFGIFVSCFSFSWPTEIEFSPSSRWVEYGKKISMSYYYKEYDIYYTLNGPEPTLETLTQSLKYSDDNKPIITEDTIIKAGLASKDGNSFYCCSTTYYMVFD
jgi:hypothetical protein